MIFPGRSIGSMASAYRAAGRRTTCTSRGPWTPTASFCSMSALRLGPVTIARALGRSSPSAAKSSSRPGRISDPRAASSRGRRGGATARAARRRGRQHHRAGVGQPVDRRRDAGALERRRLAAVDVAADRLRVRDEVVDQAHLRRIPVAAAEPRQRPPRRPHTPGPEPARERLSRAAPARVDARYPHTDDHAHDQSVNPSRSHRGATPSSTRSRRRSSSSSCSGIFTGQASVHAPHRDDACGSDGASSQPDEQRQQHRAHRPGVDRPVRRAARLPVHRTHVQARAAADAREHLAVAARAAGSSGRCRG